METTSITFDVFRMLIQQLGSYSSSVFPALMDSFGIFIKAFFILYLIIMGLGLMYGRFQDAPREIAVSMIFVAAIWGFMFESDVYFSWLIKPYVGLVMDLGSFFLSQAQGDWWPSGGLLGIFSQVDIMFGKLLFTLEKMAPDGGFLPDVALYFKVGFALLIMIFVYAAMYFSFIVLMAMSFFAIYVLAVVGGPCIFFAAFKQTRFVFYAWVRAMLNYGLLLMFVCMVMAMCIFGMNTAIDALAIKDISDDIIFSVEFASTICWGALTVGMLLKAPDFAAAISGGSAGSTTGIAGGMTMVAGAMTAGGVAMYQSSAAKAGAGLGKDAVSGMANKLSQGRVGRAFSDRKGINR